MHTLLSLVHSISHFHNVIIVTITITIVFTASILCFFSMLFSLPQCDGGLVVTTGCDTSTPQIQSLESWCGSQQGKDTHISE
jgi:hypothetical protein